MQQWANRSLAKDNYEDALGRLYAIRALQVPDYATMRDALEGGNDD